MLAAMRRKWAEGDIDAAAALARAAAPYLHGRQAASHNAAEMDMDRLSDAELRRMLDAPEDGAAGEGAP
jgi:hypothetical protein